MHHITHISQIFEQQAQNTPHKIALYCQNQAITYKQLNAQATQLAAILISEGIVPGSIIALFLERSIDLVVVMIATHKIGSAFLPIDHLLPMARIAHILKTADVDLVISQTSLLSTLELIKPHKLLFIDKLNEKTQRTIECPPIILNELAYVIFTSGSTGHPKGVMVSHDNLFSFMEAFLLRVPLSQNDVVLASTSISFDISLVEILIPLALGSTIILAQDHERKNPQALRDLIMKYNITFFQCTPTFMHYALDQPGFFDVLASLHLLLIGGEECPQKLIHKLNKLKTTAVFNMYGPTETTIWCACQKLTQTTHIGLPFDNTQFCILDEHQNALPQGLIGELYIWGPCVCLGYINDPALTKKQFISYPKNPSKKMYKTGDLCKQLNEGTFEILGRVDHQIKLNGIRIELEDIESNLMKIDLVDSAIVTIKNQVLYGHIKTQSTLTKEYLIEHLSSLVPPYMIPTHFLIHSSFPMLESGKIDRKTLAMTAAPGLPSLAHCLNLKNLSPIHHCLATIWSKLLHHQEFSLHDNFFYLGGDSLMVIQMISLLRNQGYELSYEVIYQTPTIDQLAKQATALESITSELSTPSSWQSSLLPAQQFLLQTIKNPDYWAIPLLFKFEDTRVDPDLLKQALSYIFHYHEAFHLRFQKIHNEWTQVYDPQFNTFSIPLQIQDLSTLSNEKLSLHIQRDSTRAHKSLDIQKGFMTKAILFECGPKRPQRLFLSIHHLICDGLSIIILKEELEFVYEQLRKKQLPKLPKTTSSLKDWIQKLQEAAYLPHFTEQAPFWKDQLKSLKFLPYDFEAIEIGPEHQIITDLSVDVTSSILHTIQDLKLDMRSFLLTLLIQTIHNWSQATSMSLLLTGHGREQSISKMNLSQTIGPFLSLFPVNFTINPSDDFKTLCQHVSNTLSQVPYHGIGYGLARYLGPQTVQDELAQLGIPTLGFNFVGIVGHNDPSTLFNSLISEEMGKEREQHSLPLRIAIIILDNHLSFMWSYSQDHFHETTIRALISRYMTHLESAIHSLAHS